VSDCEHLEFSCNAAVARMTDDAGRVRNFGVDIKITCTGCGLPFQFLGTPTGHSFRHPTVDLIGTTLHAPIAPGERTIDRLPARMTYEMPPAES
jgi:hypothetical protein